MGYLELNDVAYALPGGWTLFEGVAFRVPEGAHSALIGANGDRQDDAAAADRG